MEVGQGKTLMAVKIGIIGAGETVGIAHFHAKGILHDGRAEISAVYDLNPENARKFCEKFSECNHRQGL